MKALLEKVLKLFDKSTPAPAQPVNLKLLYQFPSAGLDLLAVSMLMGMSDSAAHTALHSHKDHPWLRLLKRKLDEHGAPGNLDPRILLLLLKDLDRPAISLLWAYTLFRMMQRSADTDCTYGLYLAEFMHDFYMGLPSQASYEEAWYAQKAGGVHLLDTKEQWQ